MVLSSFRLRKPNFPEKQSTSCHTADSWWCALARNPKCLGSGCLPAMQPFPRPLCGQGYQGKTASSVICAVLGSACCRPLSQNGRGPSSDHWHQNQPLPLAPRGLQKGKGHICSWLSVLSQSVILQGSRLSGGVARQAEAPGPQTSRSLAAG